MTVHDKKLVHGAGGGSSAKGGGGGGTAPNTLFSNATAKLLDLIGEGEIVGVVGGDKGIYLNGTPLQNADGTYNFKGVTTEFRVGLPDQPHMSGYPGVTAQTPVNIEVKKAVPVIQQVNEPNFDFVNVTIMVPALYFTDTKTNKTGNNTVLYDIEVRYKDGPWLKRVASHVTGKNTSPYYRDHLIELPKAPAGASNPWQILVTKLNGDSTDETLDQHSIYFFSWTGIIDTKFTYPNSAYVGITADAKLFNQALPQRAYLVDGILMPIPTNYDPVARTYTGIWDGTFKTGYTNNPAWVLNMLLINDRFGLGEFIDASVVDKWALYEIAQYCDINVSNGYGGQEPRFTYNGVLKEAREAYEVLQMVAQCFRGMTYWSSGSVTASQNRLKDPVIVVTPSNVINGKITYSSSARKARHTVAMVEWINPDNSYKSDIEVVQDDDGINRYGYNPTRVTAIGCTSRGQAMRFGLWTLLTELKEFQVATWRAGMDHAFVRPGDVAVIQDPNIADIDAGGRLRDDNTVSRLHLDHVVNTATLVAPFVLSIIMPDGTLQERTVSSFNNQADGTTYANLSNNLTEVPLANAMWLLSSSLVKPQQFIVVGFKEVETHIFEIAAIQYEPSKFPAVDDGRAFEPLPVSNFANVVKPPINLSAKENRYTENGLPRQAVLFSWTPGDPFNSKGYLVSAVKPDGTLITLPQTPSTSIDFLDTDPGAWEFYVATVGINGQVSDTAVTTLTVSGWQNATIPTITDLKVKGGTNVFNGRTCTMTWDVNYGTVPDYGAKCVVRVLDPNTLAQVHFEVLASGQKEWSYDYEVNRNEGGPRRAFIVRVAVLGVNGGEGTPTSLSVSNPAPSAVNFTLTNTTSSAFVDITKSTDNDVAGYYVTYALTSNGQFGAQGKILDLGMATETFIPFPTNTTVYFKCAAYDAFSSDINGLNFGPEQSIKITSTIFDPNGPLQPTGLALATAAEISPDGTASAVIRATWDAPDAADTNYGMSQISISEGTEPNTSYVSFNVPAGQNKWELHNLKPGQIYSVKLRSIGNRNTSSDGPFTQVQTITAAKNLTPPANPTNVVVTAGYGYNVITLTAPVEKDLKLIEVWAVVGNNASGVPAGGATLIGSIPFGSTQYFDYAVTGAQKTYWIRSQNTSDVYATTYVRLLSAVSPQIQAAALAAGIIDDTKLATALLTNVPKPLSSVPTVKDREIILVNGKLYRWDANANAYTAAVPAVDVGIGLTSAQIASLDATKIAGTLTDAQLAGIAAGKITGTLVDAQIATLSALKITNQITSAQIATLDATKIAGTLTNAQIADLAANKITGTLVSAQLADLSITLEKFASGTAPVGVVTSLPTVSGYTGPKVILNTTDGKVYRLVGSSWVTSVTAADISGTIAAGQIAALEASKITGTLTDAQIAAVAAAKVTGTLVDAQIAGMAATKLAGLVTSAQIENLQAAKIAGTITNTQIADLAANKLTGQVVSSQIADLAVTLAKFAVGTQPIATVSSLPSPSGYTGPSVLFNTNDGKMYRLVNGAWTTATAAVDLAGFITDAQIQQLSASKLAGTVPEANLASLDANKLTGSIVAARITSVNPSALNALITSAQIDTLDAVKVQGTLTNASLNTTKLVGTIISAQLADAAVTLSKFATGTQPLATVTSLPAVSGYAGPTVILNTTDGKIYRLVSGAWTSAVSNLDINGLVTSEQIAGLAATKLSGTVPEANLASLDANKLTGSIVAARITSVNPSALNAQITSAQIQQLDASKLAGTLATEVINNLNANKSITGITSTQIASVNPTVIAAGITSAQISGLDAAKLSGVLATEVVVNLNANKSITGIVASQIASVNASVVGAGLTSAQITSLDATKLSGTLATEVINNLNTNKSITGIVASQIASVNASAVGVGLTSAQITDLDAAKLSGLIAATRITDGSISTPKIATGAITAGTIAAGAIVASKLAISSENRAYNPDFSQGTRGWASGSGTLPGITASVTAPGDWAPDGFPAFYVQSNLAAGVTSTDYMDINHSNVVAATGVATNYPVLATVWYEVSVCMSTHRCRGRVLVQWLNASGAHVSYSDNATTVINNSAGGGAYKNFPKSWMLMQAPTGATQARIFFRGDQPTTGGNPYIFVSALMFCTAPQGSVQTEPSPFVSPGTTLIDGSNVFTGTLSADRIIANSITTTQILAGGINADRLVANSITAGQVAANAITAVAIAAGVITSREIVVGSLAANLIAANSISTAQLAAGGIAADRIVANSLTTAQIAAGQVNADRLIANSITAGQIATNAITAGKIDANAISAREIVAGSILASKLAVASTNMAFNTNYGQGTFGWNSVGAGATTIIARGIRTDYSPSGFNSYFMQLGNGSTADYADISVPYSVTPAGAATNRFPCNADMLYEMSAYLTIVTAGSASLIVQFWNASSGLLQTQYSNGNTNTLNGSTTAVWDAQNGRQRIFARAPAGASYFSVIIRWSSTGSNASGGGWLFASGVMIAAISAAQFAASELSPYVPDGVTTITGGSILTNSIAAGTILANSLTSAQIQAGGISADRIVANSITTSQIQAGGINADRLVANSITSDKIAANAITAVAISAGAITAREIAAGAIATNKLTVAQRNIQVVGLNIRITGATGLVQWDAGTIFYLDDNGAGQSANITASSFTRSGSNWYAIVYYPGRTYLDVSTDVNFTMNNTGAYLMATYDNSFAGLDVRYGGTIIDGDRIITNTIAATRIIANSITTAQLTAGGVNADRLVANSITAGQIATNAIIAGKIDAGAITAREITAGSILASKLTLASSNLIYNADFANEQSGWVFQGASDSGTVNITVMPLGDPWSPTGYRSLRLWPNRDPANGQYCDTALVRVDNTGSLVEYPVTQGEVYEFAVGVSVHRCTAQVYIRWLNASRAPLSPDQYSGPDGTITSTTTGASYGTPKTFPRSGLFAQAPAGATYARLIVRMLWTGGTNPYLFISVPLFSPSTAVQMAAHNAAKATGGNEFSPYVDPGVTIVSGGNILTNSLNANAIIARTLTADRLVAGTLTGNEIAANTITGTNIVGRTITSDKIVANSITAGEIASRTITAANIVSGTITVNEVSANTLTADRLQAGTLTARELAAGSILTSKLSVASMNRAFNTEYSQGTLGYSWGSNGTTTVKSNAIRDDYCPSGYTALALQFNQSANSGYCDIYVPSTVSAANVVSKNFLCQGGQIVEASAYLSVLYGGKASVIILFYNGGTNTQNNGGNFVAVLQNGTDPRSWEINGGRSKIIATAPANTTHYNILVRWEAPATAAASDTYVFVSGLMIATANAVQLTAQEVSPYVPEGGTTINGGSILTNSIGANTIVANSITTAQITAGGVNADRLVANSITASQIAANTITAGQISVRTITAANLVAGAVTAYEIAAYTITADKLVAKSITAGQIAAGTLTADLIQAGSITGDRIAGNTITGTQILANTIGTREIIANVITTNQIAANGVNADRLIANTITADKIAANAITAGKIDASAITAREIAASTIVASKLAIASDNRAFNPDTAQGTKGWRTGGDMPGLSGVGFSGWNTWAPDGFQAFAVNSGTTQANASGKYMDLYPEDMTGANQTIARYAVLASQWYEFSACVSAHRCRGRIILGWVNSAGSNISFTDSSTVNNGAANSGGSYKTFPKCWVIAQAPAGAVSVQVYFRGDNVSGDSPYLFVSAFMFCIAPAGAAQTEPSPYVPSGQTFIDGGTVMTGTLGADRIVAGSITAGQIAARTITSSNLVSNTITANEIASNTITTGQIAARTITAANLVAGAVTAYEIQASTITGDKIAVRTLNATSFIGGTITGYEIAGATITGNLIAANTIQATQIVANTIGTREIIANVITTNQIAANGVNADRLVANSITADKIATNAITAGKIDAGAISARELASGSVLTNKLSVANRGVNIVGLNIRYIVATRVIQWEDADIYYTDDNNALQSRHVGPGSFTVSGNNYYAILYQPGKTTLDYNTDLNFDKNNPGWLTIATYDNGTGLDVHYGPTIIDGGRIVTNSIYADKIVAGSITADRIAVRTLSADRFQGATITAYEIAGDTITGDKIKARTITAGNILAGSITAYEIAVRTITADKIYGGSITGYEIAGNTITADKLTANSITAGQIQAGAIGADQLAAGAITADKIGVGLNTGNMLYNSDFNGFPAGVIPFGFTSGWSHTFFSTSYAGTNGLGASWQPPGMQSLQMSVGGTPPSGHYMEVYYPRPTQDGSYTRNFPVLASQWYELSGYVSAHRSQAYLILIFQDANGTDISGGVSLSNTVENDTTAGALVQWRRCTLKAKAPVNAATCQVRMRLVANGGDNPYNFWTGIYLGKTTANANVYSDWAPASQTVIVGGTVATNSLSADKIVAGSITTDRLQAGTINADRLELNSLKTRVLAAGAVTADTITVGNGNLSSLISGTNSTKINGGSISANSIRANQLQIGMRGLNVVGLNLRFLPTTRQIVWDSGAIYWPDDGGGTSGVNVTAGSVTVPANSYYSILWYKGRGYLDSNSDLNYAATDPNWVTMATYDNSYSGLAVNYGATIIDGDRITTGSIKADRIAANEIQTYHMAANTITGDRIAAGSLVADKLASGTITAGTINIGNGRMRIIGDGNMPYVGITNNEQSAWRFVMGCLGPWDGNSQNYGMIAWNGSNQEIMKIASAGTHINGAVIDAASIGTAQIGNLTVTNAHIQNLTVGNTKFASGSLTQISEASSATGGKSVSISVSLRDGAGGFQIAVFMRGNGATSTTIATGQSTGSLQLKANGNVIQDLVVPISQPYIQGTNTTNTFYTPSFSYEKVWRPGSAANYTFELTYTGVLNNEGVTIQVTELSK